MSVSLQGHRDATGTGGGEATTAAGTSLPPSDGGDRTGTGLVPPTVRTRRRQPWWLNLVLRASGPVVLVILWVAASASGAVTSQQFPAPWEVGHAFAELARTGELWENMSVSLRRVAVGLVTGISVGLVLGIVSGLFRLGDQLIDPTVQIVRTIPVLAITPLLIIWFGIDELPKIIIISLASGIPTYINTHLGVRHVDSRLIEAGRAYGLGHRQLVWTVVIPEALPQILLGFRIAMTAALGALVVAELSNTQTGLGFLMTSAQQYFQTDIVVACIVIYAAAGLLADTVVRVLERVTMPYKFSREPRR
ncbi:MULTISPECIES: ABC transporter permease [Corynebacterium]|uniref:Aliphatic sulfonates transport permease protein SsuC n=1 Tax=Corynebacterium provencense TaxID=1737425 RepID=A0A2Z3YTU1_9CORY|nr:MULTISPECIES: ABC transporter permease [Corynebacterium]AWT26610.1 Putative aliphatic sulfonates transport permease protein SsuC [Corynebacterium provencense]MCI1257344.1 ABC transporter permease [Corynebacterium provencense]